MAALLRTLLSLTTPTTASCVGACPEDENGGVVRENRWKFAEVRDAYEKLLAEEAPAAEAVPRDALRPYAVLLGQLVEPLRKWARTDVDAVLVTRVEDALCRARALPETPSAEAAALMKDVARLIERAQVVLRFDLHNSTIGSTTEPGKIILNCSALLLENGDVVVDYPVSGYRSDAVIDDWRPNRMVSHDGGITWETHTGQPIRTRWESQMECGVYQWHVYPGEGPFFTQTARVKDGTLIEAFFTGWENFPDTRREELQTQGYLLFDEAAGNLKGIVSVARRILMRRSRDNGATWEASDIPLPQFMAQVADYRPGLALSGGAFLYPVWGRFAASDSENSCFALRTEDGGDTWEMHLVAPAQSALGFNETVLAEASSGDVVAIMRTSEQKELWQSTSGDGGKTWSTPRFSGMRGSTPAIVTIKDGLLVCVFSRREKKIFPESTGMWAGISHDNGLTWESFLIDTEGIGWVDGYPEAVALPDGRVFVTYCLARNGRDSDCSGTSFYPGEVSR